MKRISLVILMTLFAYFVPTESSANYHYDVNGDGVVNVTDVNLVVSYILKGDVNIDKQTFTVSGVKFTMIKVEHGKFTMGLPGLYAPIHEVTLTKDYWIGETEVTQALWKAVMGTNPSYTKGDDLPVELVSWNDCKTFITKLNQKTGKTFRLPTEAEWEFAAKGGNWDMGCYFPGSNQIDDVAWYWRNSDWQIHPVKTKSPNELGLYDMGG